MVATKSVPKVEEKRSRTVDPHRQHAKPNHKPSQRRELKKERKNEINRKQTKTTNT